MREITSYGYRLVHQNTGAPVYYEDIIRDFRGDEHVITGGRSPHKPSSTGRVYTARSREFFPTVFKLIWVEGGTL